MEEGKQPGVQEHGPEHGEPRNQQPHRDLQDHVGATTCSIMSATPSTVRSRPFARAVHSCY